MTLLTLAVVSAIFSCGREEEAPVATDVVRPVKLMTVGSGNETVGRALPGSVNAAKQVELSFQIDGTLIALPVKEGQRVEKGDLVARLDPRDLETELRGVAAQVERAQALLRLSTTEYERLVRVKEADPGAVAQSHLDRALERTATARADLLSAEAALDKAKLQLNYTYLNAPFSGIVSSLKVDIFQEVRAKQPILTMDDLTLLEVVVEVPESLMAPIRSPGSYTFYAEFAPAPGQRFPLTLQEYAVRGDPKTLTYRVTFQMEQPTGINILPGMTANVMAEPKGGEISSIVVPVVALFSQEGESPHVWVVDESMTVHARPVKTGNLVGTDRIEIEEGLQNGETIAVSAVQHLREGMQVRKFEE